MTDSQNQPLSVPELQAAIIVAATELATRWLPNVPGADTHVASGAGLTLEVELRPTLCLTLYMVDSNGERIRLAWKNYPLASSAH